MLGRQLQARIENATVFVAEHLSVLSPTLENGHRVKLSLEIHLLIFNMSVQLMRSIKKDL